MDNNEVPVIGDYTIWKHKRTGVSYCVLATGLKMKLNNSDWHEAVLYMNADNRQQFVRDKSHFLENFEEIP